MAFSLKVNMWRLFKSLIRNSSGESSKSFGLVISALVGAIIGLSIAFILVWDIVVDGVIDTDLSKLGIFILCVGCYTFGSGANKMLSEVAGGEVMMERRRRRMMARNKNIREDKN